MALPYIPIQDSINIARISQYLASNERARQDAFGGGFLNINIPALIRVARESLEWAYGRNPSDTSLIPISNYLYSLCDRWANTARTILNTVTSGGTIINPSTGLVSTIIALQFQFTVGQTGSLMNAGQTTLTLAYANVMRNSEEVVYNGTPLYIGKTDAISYTITYNANDVVILFNQGVQDNDTISVKILQYATL